MAPLASRHPSISTLQIYSSRARHNSAKTSVADGLGPEHDFLYISFFYFLAMLVLCFLFVLSEPTAIATNVPFIVPMAATMGKQVSDSIKIE